MTRRIRDPHGYIRMTRTLCWATIITGSAASGFLAGLLIQGLR